MDDALWVSIGRPKLNSRGYIAGECREPADGALQRYNVELELQNLKLTDPFDRWRVNYYTKKVQQRRRELKEWEQRRDARLEAAKKRTEEAKALEEALALAAKERENFTSQTDRPGKVSATLPLFGKDAMRRLGIPKNKRREFYEYCRRDACPVNYMAGKLWIREGAEVSGYPMPRDVANAIVMTAFESSVKFFV